MTADDDVLNDQKAQTMADRAANGEGAEPEDEQTLFPAGSLPGDDVTPQNVVKRGLPVEFTVSLTKAEVPSRSGMLDPNKRGRVLVTYLPGKVEEVPQREGDETKVASWKVRQTLRAVYVEAAGDPVELIRSEFEQLRDQDARAAGSLLEQLQAMLAEALQTT